jgi:hypothetical protein
MAKGPQGKKRLVIDARGWKWKPIRSSWKTIWASGWGCYQRSKWLASISGGLPWEDRLC